MKLSRIMLALVAVAMVACTEPATRCVDSITSFIAQVEAQGMSYGDAEWAAADQEFERLCAEAEANYESMTPEQQRAVTKAMGEYNGIKLRLGLKSIQQEATKILDKAPSLVEGFFDGLTEE